MTIHKAGDDGEKAVLRILQKLPNDYTIFPSFVFDNGGEYPAELDFLVAEKNGLFVVEVKNHEGDFYGISQDVFRQQRKEDRYGVEHFDSMKNPCGRKLELKNGFLVTAKKRNRCMALGCEVLIRS